MTLATTPARGKGLATDQSPTTDLSLEDVRQRVQRDDRGKWDTLVPRTELELFQGRLAFQANQCPQAIEPTPWSVSQLCTRLGIPTPYFRKCPAELQDAQANYWLRYGRQKAQEQWLLRLHHNTVRAVLSEHYSPLDNATLLDELRPLLPDSYRVDWFGLSDESLHLRVVDPQRYREVLPDDALTVGIHIANSEVGYRSVTVDALVYRLVCKNGLIRLVKGKSLMRQRHLHVSEMRFVGVLGEAIANALQESEGFLQQLQAATQTPVPDMAEVLEKIAERWHLSEETQETVKQSLQREPASQQESLYGLVNAYTAAAQHLPDEGRYDLEVLAGNLAAQGVAAYAPHRKRRRSESDVNHDPANQIVNQVAVVDLNADLAEGAAIEPSNGQKGGGEKSIEEKSIVELAREMFDAEIVGRSSSLSSPGSLTAVPNGSAGSNGRHS